MSSWVAPEEFAEFVRGRHAALLNFAHLISGDPHTAADLVQEALIRTGTAWSRVKRQDDPEAYVRAAIANLNVNRWRRARRERLVDTVPDRGRLDEPPRDDAVWHALARLPKVQRTVLVLRYYEDLSQAQIATVLGCPLNTVKSHNARAMERLRTLLGPETGGAPDSPAPPATPHAPGTTTPGTTTPGTTTPGTTTPGTTTPRKGATA